MLTTSIRTAVATAIICTCCGSAIAASTALSGETLREAVADKTVVLKISGFQLPIRYAADGTMQGRMSAVAAALSGGQGLSDHGKWWVDGGQLCQKWSSWMKGQTYCYALSRAGNNVRWVRSDGRAGTARIAG
ncbi:MAG: hypothetical protein AAF405_06905 [Pseudomonadota bacterium]